MVKLKTTKTEKSLSLVEKRDKINFFQKLADSSAQSKDLSKKIGACAVYASLIDFSAIQSVRLLEQILLNAEIQQGKKPSFIPHGDDFFYDERLDTRRLVKEIKKFLPFRATGGAMKEDAEMINRLALDFINEVNDFLDNRNTLLHHIGSPRQSIVDIDNMCNLVISQYKKCSMANARFILAAQPFGLTANELKHFN